MLRLRAWSLHALKAHPYQKTRLSSPQKRRRRCLHCAGCLRARCGECTACRKMPKFGGTGELRVTPCERRKCLNPVITSPASCAEHKDGA
mmetsp:Transcript_15707/g.51378  ORF Transcript_15707/g.51378 Transcript_15707/m.51378 type:complete len:90 (-) Transcript_15707:183-452(-)